MKQMILLTGAALLWSACGTTGTRQAHEPQDPAEYQITEQPQANVTGSGTVMRGAYELRTPATGAFTGKETVHGEAGTQYPTPPPQSEAGQMVHSAPSEDPTLTPSDSGIVTPRDGAGAGTLGQTGLQPGRPVTTTTIMTEPQPPGETLPGTDANSSGTIPTTDADLPSDLPARDVGASAAAETGNATEAGNLPPAVQPGGITSVDPARTPTGETPLDDLTLRVQEVLRSGRPGTSTQLTPEGEGNIRIEAREGVVTLRGEVRSQAEKQAIGDRVERVEGVAGVNNQLRVRAPGTGLPAANSPADGSPQPQPAPRP